MIEVLKIKASKRKCNIQNPALKEPYYKGKQMYKILVVDDDEFMREMLIQMISKTGKEVFSASNGIEAEDICTKESVDLVIIDMVMPERDGYQTITELKRNHKNLKIIAISGGDICFDATSYLMLVKDRGAHRTFTKPFNHSEFLSTIDEMLKNSSPC